MNTSPEPRSALSEENRLLIILFFVFGCVFVDRLTISFLFPMIAADLKLSNVHLGTLSAVLALTWALSGAGLGAISDRFGRKPTLIFFSLLAVCCPLFLSYVDNPWLLGVLVFLSYTGLGCFTLFMATIPSETVSPARIATALGLVMGIGEVIGGCLAPFIAGLLADRYGLVSVMWLAAAGAVCAGVLSCFLDETAPAVVNRRAVKPAGVADV
ncbi:MFS transporter [Serratia marcescens]|uniref:MFS transporter n=1 Tax=Serratia marcescens TaxID=615 RepID=UPI00211EE3FF|nr:MFS transporter [Serratia marcescens]